MSDQTLLSLIIPAVVGLASAVGILWKHILKQHCDTSKKLDESRIEYKDTNDKLIELTAKVGVLEGRQEGVEKLAASVLKEIRKLEPKK